MTRSLIAFILLFASVNASAQNFIGMNEHKVKKMIAGMKPGFSHGVKTETEQYSFVRYQSDDETETWIVFFDDEGLCKAVRVTCDSIMVGQKRKELNNLYTINGIDSWKHFDNDQEINIDLKCDKWSLTITYRKANKKVQSGNS